jgi:hypothetical protein
MTLLAPDAVEVRGGDAPYRGRDPKSMVEHRAQLAPACSEGPVIAPGTSAGFWSLKWWVAAAVGFSKLRCRCGDEVVVPLSMQNSCLLWRAVIYFPKRKGPLDVKKETA